MKQLVAIASILLLLAAPALAVSGPVSGGAVAEADCCCDDCLCCVGEPGAPVVPPVEATAPVTVQNFITLLPPTFVGSLLVPAAHDLPPSLAASLPAAAQPLYRRNCALLI